MASSRLFQGTGGWKSFTLPRVPEGASDACWRDIVAHVRPTPVSCGRKVQLREH
jgi:hypothetical protein